jgi:CrcB protein
MKQALVVGLGGLIGSVARYKLGGIVLHHSASWRFPLSTFVVNIIGCFAIGALAALVEHRDFFTSDTRLFLFTGLLGGFTTFSAFAYEGFFLLRRGEMAVALAYVGLSVIVGLAAAWIAFGLFGLGRHH